MNQPPTPASTPPQWRRPPGVASGTWDYVHQGAIADRYDEFVADVSMAKVEHDLLQQCFPPLKKTGSCVIIDLGCGTGRTAIPLAGAGYDVIAVDLSQPMLAQLNSKLESTSKVDGRGTVFPLRANLVQLDGISDAISDHAVCLFSTLGMIAGRGNRQQMLRHVRRLVRPGGTFLIHVHHRWAALREPGGIVNTIRSIAKSRFDKHHEFGDSVYAYRGLQQMFMHRFGRAELTADLRGTGWKVNHCYRLSIDGERLTGRIPMCGGFFVIASAV